MNDSAGSGTLQSRVRPWLLECFGELIAGDREERNHRFLEEALELIHSLGCTANEAHQLVDYVFGRPAGYPPQEVGGVMITLAALCLANDLDMHSAGEIELARITVPETVAKIRAKQAGKPKHSPLPQHVRAMSRYRHQKRGTEYQLQGQAEMQCERPVREGAMVEVYRGTDGKLWARPAQEFHDGRFVKIDSKPPQAVDAAE